MKQNVLKALRLLFISPTELLQVRQIKRSGLFDRAFYLASNPRMHRLNRWLPERHYLTRGEKAGFYPYPEFSPQAYLAHNPDVAHSGLPPLLHYIRIGRQENRLTAHVSEIEPGTPLRSPILRARPTATAPQAIVIHLYYHELWPEFAAVRLAGGQTGTLELPGVELGGGHNEIAQAGKVLTKVIQQWADNFVRAWALHGFYATEEIVLTGRGE